MPNAAEDDIGMCGTVQASDKETLVPPWGLVWEMQELYVIVVYFNTSV